MTLIKLCGLCRVDDVKTVNELKPEYAGFVFAETSKRYVSPSFAAELKSMLSSDIKAVGVFVDEPVAAVAALLNGGVIDMAQLHGKETDDYIRALRDMTGGKTVIKAIRLRTEADAEAAEKCDADYVLLDSGAGGGKVFDWRLASLVDRPYFLAGGLDKDNVAAAIRRLHPFAVDVSSGIERDGVKDNRKMAAFVAAVRGGENHDQS